MKPRFIIPGIATAIIAVSIGVAIATHHSQPQTGSTCEPVAAGAATTVNSAIGVHDYAAIVEANTANSSLPSLSSDAQAAVAAALKNGTDGKQHVAIISATATPQVVPVDLMPLSPTGTEAGNAEIVNNNLELINMALTRPPASKGMSLFEGIGLARDWLTSQGAASPIIITVGSGLDDTGPFTTTGGLLGNDPDQIANNIAAANPSLNLAGTTVLAQSLGYTAPPQQSATDAQRQLITDAWKTTLSKLGANLITDPMPAPTCSVTTDLPVGTTDFPAPKIDCTQQTLDMSMPSVLLFAGDKADLRDNADEALTPLLTAMTNNPQAQLALTGHTALVPNEGQDHGLGLSVERSQAVAAWLENHGIAASRITATGVGDSQATCQLNPDGSQAPCAGNDRTVDAHLTGVTSCPK